MRWRSDAHSHRNVSGEGNNRKHGINLHAADAEQTECARGRGTEGDVGDSFVIPEFASLSKPRAGSKSNRDKHFAQHQQCSKSCATFTGTVVIQPKGSSDSQPLFVLSLQRGNRPRFIFQSHRGEDGVVSRFPPH